MRWQRKKFIKIGSCFHELKSGYYCHKNGVNIIQLVCTEFVKEIFIQFLQFILITVWFAYKLVRAQLALFILFECKSWTQMLMKLIYDQ